MHRILWGLVKFIKIDLLKFSSLTTIDRIVNSID